MVILPHMVQLWLITNLAFHRQNFHHPISEKYCIMLRRIYKKQAYNPTQCKVKPSQTVDFHFTKMIGLQLGKLTFY